MAIDVAPERPYVQAQFEEAMAWAVKYAAAVWCPMTHGPSCSVVTQSRDYALSLRYLMRPWCFFECRSALMRSVLWSRTPTAFTVEGVRAESRRVAVYAVIAWVFFVYATVDQLRLLLAVIPSISCEVEDASEANQMRCGAFEWLTLVALSAMQVSSLAFFALTGGHLIRTLSMAEHISSRGQPGLERRLGFRGAWVSKSEASCPAFYN